MRAVRVLLLALQCAVLARGQTANCTADTDLQPLYKVFAQNGAAFNTFLDLIPVRRQLCLRWLPQSP